MQIISNINEKEWNEFLQKNEKSTIYHTPEWKKFLEKTFNYKPFYLFAKDECGSINGFLPLFQINSKITGNRLCSVPFSHECLPLGKKEVIDELINALITLNQNINTEFIELRSDIFNSSFVSYNLFSTYILYLSTIEKTFKLIHKSARRYIEKSMKNLKVTNSNFEEDLDDFYNINCNNKKNKGVPAHPKVFFRNLVASFPDSTHIYLGKLGQDPIGGILTIDSGNNNVIYGYGASDPNYLRYSPLYACLWKSIEYSCYMGYTHFDFGRVSYDNVGLIEFKKKWGTYEKKLYYNYYPYYKSSVSNKRDNWISNLSTKAIRCMPVPVYKNFSDKIFWNFG